MALGPETAARRIARNAASVVLGDAAGDVLIAYTVVLAAKSLGPRGFGTLSEAQAFMDPFDVASALGLANVALRFAASRGGCDGTLRGTILGIRLTASVVAAAVGIAVAFLTHRGELWPLLLAIGAGMLLASADMAAILPFQWHQSVHRRIAVPFFIGLLRLGAACVATWFLATPLGYQLAILAGGVGSVLLNMWWALRVYPDPLRYDRALARELLSVGWPAALFAVVVVFYDRAGYFLLRDSGVQQLGQYAAAERLTRPIISVASAICFSSLPTIGAMAVGGDLTRLRTVYRRSLLGSGAVLAPLVGAAWFAAPWLLTRFAPSYAQAGGPLRVLAIGALFVVLNIISTVFLTALGRFRVMIAIAVLDLVIYLLLASRLIPTHGALGAALSTTIMEGINVVVQVVAVRRWCLAQA